MQYVNLQRGRWWLTCCTLVVKRVEKWSASKAEQTAATATTSPLSSNDLNLQFEYAHKGMAMRIGYLHLTRWCKSRAAGLNAARKGYIPRGVQSFSSTRIFAQDTEAAPTHGFSNGQNLGSITLKKNGVYLENKLRIVSGVNDRSTDIRLTQ